MGKGKHQLQSLNTEAAHRIIQHFSRSEMFKKKKKKSSNCFYLQKATTCKIYSFGIEITTLMNENE